MAKPASGTALDSGNSLYSHLTAAGSAVWGMLEGSGGTSADSSGNGFGLTLSGFATWGTNGSGEAIINTTASSGQTIAITTGIHLASGSVWSFAFRMKVNVTGTIYTLFGRDTSSNSSYLWADDGTFGYYVPVSQNAADFTGATNWTTDADWLLVVDGVGLKIHLYRNGTEVTGSPLTIVAADAEFYFRSLGSGYNNAGGNSLVGSMTYGYLMNGYAATGSDAVALAANPYSIFTAGAPAQDTPELYGRPHGSVGQRQMSQLLAM